MENSDLFSERVRGSGFTGICRGCTVIVVGNFDLESLPKT
jgi:hypothetical protein